MQYLLLLTTVLGLAVANPLPSSGDNMAQIDTRQTFACAVGQTQGFCNTYCSVNANSVGACFNCCSSVRGNIGSVYRNRQCSVSTNVLKLQRNSCLLSYAMFIANLELFLVYNSVKDTM